MLVLLLAYSLTQSGRGDGAPISTIEGRELSSCNDLNSCRSLSNIIWSCLTTIFLCTWVSIHPNIAFTRDEKNIGWFKKGVMKPLHGFITYKLPLFLVALLVPEYILAWAIRQYLVAGRIQKKYSNVPGWTRTHGFFVIMGGFHLFELPATASSNAISSKDGMTAAFVLSRLHSREDEIPRRALGIDDLPADILHAVTPTESELMDRGKSDAIAKFIVLVQILWFVVQCIARGTQHLPLTELEVVTLAYAMMNFFIYGFWWDKPRDVACPIRVYAASENSKLVSHEGWFWTLFYYVLGLQDQLTSLSREWKVPMFWSGLVGVRVVEMEATASKSYLGPAVLGMGFGAIHFIAWSTEFPSHLELVLWRSSCIVMMGVPLIATVLCSMIVLDADRTFWLLINFVLVSVLALTAWLYIAARIATIIIAFTALRSLPSKAFIVVDWTTFIPHI